MDMTRARTLYMDTDMNMDTYTGMDMDIEI
jgi:hypothetical protein